MIIINSKNIDRVLWSLREAQRALDSTPIIFAKRQIGRYIVQLGSLGHLYNAVNELLEVVVAAGNMAEKLGIGEYSVVAEPSRAYITPELLPEIMPPLPKARPVEPAREPEININYFNCSDISPEYIKFCIKNIEIAYYRAI